MSSVNDQAPQHAPAPPALPHMNSPAIANAVSLADTAAIMLSEKVIRSKLSPTLAGIAEVISVDATLKLCETFGGSRVYIAEKPTRHSAIARALGFEAACKLGKTYGREELNIPRGAELRRVIRNDKIKRARKDGKTIPELTREFGLSMRQVMTILAGG